MANKKKKGGMRVIELQSYLRGIVDFSGDDWHPTKEQWNNILNLIWNIKEEEPKEVVREVVNVGAQAMQPMVRHPQGPIEIHDSSLSVDAGQPNQPAQQFEPINGTRKQDMRKVLPKAGAVKVASDKRVSSSGITIVTNNKEADDTASDFL